MINLQEALAAPYLLHAVTKYGAAMKYGALAEFLPLVFAAEHLNDAV